jgi:hypothetical protein
VFRRALGRVERLVVNYVNNNNKVLIAKLSLDLLNKTKDSRDKCSL